MFVPVVQVVGGLIGLFLAGEIIIKAVNHLGRLFRFSPFLIGMVLLGFCSSAPELVITTAAVLKGQANLAVGNVIGSNIANILLILGLVCLLSVFKPQKTNWTHLSMWLLSAFLIGLAAVFFPLTRGAGIVMVVLLIGYLLATYLNERKQTYEVDTNALSFTWKKLLWEGFKFIAGVAALLLSADVFLKGSVTVAEMLGMSQAAIGLTLVAFGTSLPELVLSGLSAWRGHSELAFANVTGSNMFNTFFVLGVPAIIHPFRIHLGSFAHDIILLCSINLIVAIIWYRRWHFTRILGSLMLVAYAAFIYSQF